LFLNINVEQEAIIPSYTFLNRDTNEQWTETMSMSAREQFLNDNPHVEQLIVSAPSYVADSTRVGVNAKPNNHFRDRLKQIAKNNPGNRINTF
jgi:hypothetical protein